MRKFSISIDIAAPVERVWQVMSDVDHWHEWTPSITSIKRLGDKPFAVGTRAVVKQPKFPPAFWKVDSIEPGRSFTWVSTAPGMRVIGYHAVEPINGGSRATLSIEYHGIVGSWFGGLTKGITQRYIALEAHGLKARSEDPTYRHDGRR